jgi:hypothetical protein
MHPPDRLDCGCSALHSHPHRRATRTIRKANSGMKEDGQWSRQRLSLRSASTPPSAPPNFAAHHVAVHDGPSGRGARGVKVRIDIIHWPYHASIEANDRRTCARRGVTVYARSSIPIKAPKVGMPAGTCQKRGVSPPYWEGHSRLGVTHPLR